MIMAMVNVQPRAVKGAVIRLAAEQFDDAAHPRSRTASSLSTTRAQAPMPMMVPWRRRSKGNAASATWSLVVAAPTARKPAPTHSIRFSPVTSSAPMTTTRRQAAVADPVFGDGNALGRAGAGGVDLGVGATSADVLGELAMTHGQEYEEEAPVEEIRLMFQFLAQGGDAAADLALCG